MFNRFFQSLKSKPSIELQEITGATDRGLRSLNVNSKSDSSSPSPGADRFNDIAASSGSSAGSSACAARIPAFSKDKVTYQQMKALNKRAWAKLRPIPKHGYPHEYDVLNKIITAQPTKEDPQPALYAVRCLGIRLVLHRFIYNDPSDKRLDGLLEIVASQLDVPTDKEDFLNLKEYFEDDHILSEVILFPKAFPLILRNSVLVYSLDKEELIGLARCSPHLIKGNEILYYKRLHAMIDDLAELETLEGHIDIVAYMLVNHLVTGNEKLFNEKLRATNNLSDLAVELAIREGHLPATEMMKIPKQPDGGVAPLPADSNDWSEFHQSPFVPDPVEKLAIFLSPKPQSSNTPAPEANKYTQELNSLFTPVGPISEAAKQNAEKVAETTVEEQLRLLEVPTHPIITPTRELAPVAPLTRFQLSG